VVSVARRSSSPPLGTAVDSGLRYLAGRSHSRVELRRKLGRKGFGEDEVEAALDRLTELGYLDDDAFARAVVRRRSTSRGRIAIIAELVAKGVSRPAADEAVADFDPAVQLKAATRLAERLYAEKPPPGYREMLDRIGSKLARRGYSTTIVRAACRAVWDRTSDGLEA
jgi:regulatory protein